MKKEVGGQSHQFLFLFNFWKLVQPVVRLFFCGMQSNEISPESVSRPEISKPLVLLWILHGFIH